jgi:urease accessory protein
MKLSLNSDFTKLPRAGAMRRASQVEPGSKASATITIPHDDRHLRRKALTLSTGERILVDLAEPVSLETGDRLVIEDGRQVEVVAAEEELLEIRGRDPLHLTQIAWHIGNRHLAAAIEPERILILRDHVIQAMLEGLGATVTERVEIFEPVRGAYSDHAAHGHPVHNDHDHGHSSGHGHSHD